MHFPYVYEYVGSQITIVRGSIFVTSVTVSQGNGPIALFHFGGSLNLYGKIQFRISGIKNPDETGVVSDSKIFIHTESNDITTSQTAGVQFSTSYPLIDNAKVDLEDCTVLSQTKARISFTRRTQSRFHEEMKAGMDWYPTKFRLDMVVLVRLLP